MSLTKRQPICLIRLKKRSSIHNTTTYQDTQSSILLSQLPLTSKNTNIQDRTQINHMQYDSLKQNQQNRTQYSSNLVVNFQAQLRSKIRKFQEDNQELRKINLEIMGQLVYQRGEKVKLEDRIGFVQKELVKLQAVVEQECNTDPISFVGARRYSFGEYGTNQCADYSVRAKQYKNLLSIEKIRSSNLERQLAVCRQNMRFQYKNELETLQRKVDQLKDTISRKDKEINEKQDLIQRHILKK